MRCNFYRCNKETKESPKPGEGFALCKKHREELNALLAAEPFSPKALCAWWVEAQGGALRAAERFSKSPAGQAVTKIFTELWNIAGKKNDGGVRTHSGTGQPRGAGSTTDRPTVG